MPIKMVDWKDLKDQFNDAILLGNGASIALYENFNYGSLKQHIVDNGLLTEDVDNIFNFFHTDDSEIILRIVWQATNINRSLDIEYDKTEQAYQHVRDSLISAARDIHPEHRTISNHIPNIYNFLKRFNTIINLNYDLIVYWVMMHGLDIKDMHALKDFFVGSFFDDDWQRFREPIGGQRQCSLVFIRMEASFLPEIRSKMKRKFPQRDLAFYKVNSKSGHKETMYRYS